MKGGWASIMRTLVEATPIFGREIFCAPTGATSLDVSRKLGSVGSSIVLELVLVLDFFPPPYRVEAPG
jgi:hypothetical protein